VEIVISSLFWYLYLAFPLFLGRAQLRTLCTDVDDYLWYI
jgi:hypothetical protein